MTRRQRFAGQTAVVESVLGGSDELHRLREIGLRDGATVEMIRPGNPCLVRLVAVGWFFGRLSSLGDRRHSVSTRVLR